MYTYYVNLLRQCPHMYQMTNLQLTTGSFLLYDCTLMVVDNYCYQFERYKIEIVATKKQQMMPLNSNIKNICDYSTSNKLFFFFACMPITQ